VALLLGSLLAACGRRSETTEADTSDVVGVTTAEARVDNLRDVAAAPGTIVPSVAGDWTVYAPEAGEIIELPVKEADVVAPGDLLVRFEIASATQELAALQLQVLEAETRLDRARTNLNRETSLHERGLTSRNAYEASRSEVTAAESNLAQAKTLFESARVGQERTTVRARFAGRIVKVWHGVGDIVSGGNADPVLRVIDPTRVQVAVQLPIMALARIVPGQSATVRAIAGTADEQALVASKPAAADPNAPTAEVRLAFVNPATLPVDTPVSVEILLEQRTGVVVVPGAAVQRDDMGPFVMVAGGDNRAHRRDVRLGLVTREQAQIAAVIDAGERVIVAGVSDVVDGTAIVQSR
jgi:RND family efflux transporter MFP subunit